ncbi:MAG: nitrogen regulation protein NR(II) [Chromatiales bacterium]|nr:nitrogen regulation protein NR(II) [Chromatiales bacterium]
MERIIENLHTAVMVLDEGLRLRYINPAGEILFAASAQRFVGLPIQELIFDDELVEALAQVIETNSPFTERELVLNLGFDHRVTVDLTALPLQEDGGGAGLLVEMKQQDRHLRISREEGLLAQGNATRALVRGLAHEIKNPLGGLRGAAQLLERELHNEELKEYTNIIISEADRLQSLMNQMLGPNTLPRQQVLSIHEPLERVRQVVAAELSEKIRIKRDYDPSIPEIHADMGQLIQALMNLVRNAAQAVGEEGEITLRTRSMRRYTIGTVQHKLVVRVDVIDNGPGISEEMRESLFLPMITGRAEGTGLGLPIAQSMVNLNGGLIEWESQPGKTVFTVLLPVVA